VTPTRYRLLKYPWHTGHDYELSKLPHDWFYLACTYREWTLGQRPIPPHVEWVPHQAFVSTDAMVLHVDHWTCHEPAKRQLFLAYKNAYSGPKIVINHGCNMVDGCTSEEMAELIQGCFMVCNSSTAQRLWQVSPSRYIRHGMSPEEWPTTSHARNDVLVVQSYSRSKAAYRNLDGVAAAEERVKVTWVGRDKTFDSFDKYRHYIQNSSIFFQPSYASPNPRSRTEAMLTGLVVVTTDSHGESEYIDNGVNGFASNDLDELIDFMVYLQRNPKERREIGRRGRETAQRIFHIDNFIAQWNELLSECVG
jgi:hypothetical protein